MSSSPCPPRQELDRLLDEQLDPAELARISAHVASCPACQRTLESLTVDPGPDLPSWHGWTSDEPPPPRSDFLDRIKRKPPASPSTGPDCAAPP